MLLERIRDDLQVPLESIDSIARTASHRYRTYRIRKKHGGSRTIHHPARELKALQRWLLRNIIENMPIHPAATAYHARGGILVNAIAHRSQRFLLRMDFRNFFPSIYVDDIDAVLGDLNEVTMGWTERDRRWFLAVVTRRRRLCIGAPSSPWLSNAVCHVLDRELTVESAARGVQYTRYADDLFFSCLVPDVLWNFPGVVQHVLDRCRYPRRLVINGDKTQHSSSKGRRIVTGLVITPTASLSVGRPLKRKVRAFIFRQDELSKKERGWLSGMLAHLQSVEPAFVNRLALKYGAERVNAAKRNP